MRTQAASLQLQLSPIALACAKVCGGGITIGLDVLAPFCVTYEAGMPLHYLRRIVEGKPC